MEPERRRVVVTGVGLLTPLGSSVSGVHAALCEGRSGLGAPRGLAIDGLPPLEVGEIVDFDARSLLGAGNLRALDRTSRLAACAARLALDSCGWPSSEQAGQPERGLVLGTMFGSIHTISEFDRRCITAGPSYVLPLAFANTVINAAAGQTAIWHGLRGVNATVAGGTVSGTQALAYAADLIRSGQAEYLLAGGVEELCFESLYGFWKGGWLCRPRAQGGFPVPLHRRRNGFALSEGAALLALEDAERAGRRGARVLAEIRGHGSSYEPALAASGGARSAAIGRAVAAALEDAGASAEEIDCLSLSANGSPTLDRCEAEGVAQVFGARAAELPVTAVKSALGEALGASGALQAVLLIEAMRSGVLPGIRGLDEIEPDLPLARAGSESRSLSMSRGLVSSVGLDGQASSLVLELRRP